MLNRRLAFTTILLMTTATPALAAASPEGAARIASALQTYLGSQQGVVTVTPQGETYALKLDFNPLFAKAIPADFSGSMSALEMTVTEQGGGKWKVDQDQAIEFSFKGGGVADITGKLANYKGTGIFVEALGYFESSSGVLTGLTYNHVMTPPGESAQNVAYTVGAMDYSTTMAPAGADSANGTTHYRMTNLVETISMPADPAGGTPPIDLTISLASMTQDATVKGMKFKPLTNIVAFLVAHPSKELMIVDQTAFKDHVRSAIPWFDRIEGTATADTLKVASPMGEFGASKMTIDVAMNGIVNDGYLREKFAFEGITAPPGIIPPWAIDMVPSSFVFDFDVSGFDLASPAGMMLDNLDLSKDPPLPKEMEQQLLSALLPQGIVKIGLGPSSVVTKISQLGARGSMTVGPMAMPVGEAEITLAGYDALLAAIQAVPAEMGMGQMIPMMMMAKGMSKLGENGAFLWEIKSTPEGSVTINGVDPMKM